MKRFMLICVSLLLLALTGCVSHSGLSDDSASLCQSNFKIVAENISGQASRIYVLGIGGFNKLGIVEEAKINLLENYPLKENQTLANMTVNRQDMFIAFLFIKTTYIVTADIVEFE